jgi:hypothetical protein
MKRKYKISKEFISGDRVYVRNINSGNKFYAIFYST